MEEKLIKLKKQINFIFIILKKFLMQPSIVIAIIDQTDIGDELHRYQSLSDKSLELTDTKITNEFKKKFFKINTKLSQYY